MGECSKYGVDCFEAENCEFQTKASEEQTFICAIGTRLLHPAVFRKEKELFVSNIGELLKQMYIGVDSLKYQYISWFDDEEKKEIEVDEILIHFKRGWEETIRPKNGGIWWSFKEILTSVVEFLNDEKVSYCILKTL